jgi:hypothetical protein
METESRHDDQMFTSGKPDVKNDENLKVSSPISWKPSYQDQKLFLEEVNKLGIPKSHMIDLIWREHLERKTLQQPDESPKTNDEFVKALFESVDGFRKSQKKLQKS